MINDRMVNTMNCVRAQQLVKPYLDGLLSDRELEEFLDHVQNCQDCFDELEVYFSIYRTLDNVDEKGDYNFTKKLHRKLEDSRMYLRRRYQGKVVRAIIILLAETVVIAAFWGMIYLPGGYLEQHQNRSPQPVGQVQEITEEFSEEFTSKEEQSAESGQE